MFKNIFKPFSQELGIDLGTSATIIYARHKGIIINEPSVVALNLRNEQILAVGAEAQKMIGKTPPHISAVKPLNQGVISNFEVAEKMLKYFIEKIHREKWAFFPRPTVVITIPSGTTEVEKKAVEDATINAGAREVYLIEQPMALAIGARLPVQESLGNMVVNIGAGTMEAAVISLGGIVNSRFLREAGDKLDQDIINFCRDEFNLLLGERTAEELKIKLGSALVTEEKTAKVKGRDLLAGLPKEIEISNTHLQAAFEKTINNFIETIKTTVETTPPELVADIYSRGMVLGGGSALLPNLDQRISKETKIPVTIADDSLLANIRGIGIILEDIETLKHLLTLPTPAFE